MISPEQVLRKPIFSRDMIRPTKFNLCTEADKSQLSLRLEMRSVQRGIYPIALSTMNELFL